jgi:hypothetical protein
MLLILITNLSVTHNIVKQFKLYYKILSCILAPKLTN